MPKQIVYYQLEFHMPGFIKAYVLLPNEQYRRKFTDYRGPYISENEQGVADAIEQAYPGAQRLYEDEMQAERQTR